MVEKKIRKKIKDWIAEISAAITREELCIESLEDKYNAIRKIGMEELRDLYDVIRIVRRRKPFRFFFEAPTLKVTLYDDLTELDEPDYLRVGGWAKELIEEELRKYPTLSMADSDSVIVLIDKQEELFARLMSAEQGLRELHAFMSDFRKKIASKSQDESYALPALEIGEMRINYSINELVINK